MREFCIEKDRRYFTFPIAIKFIKDTNAQNITKTYQNIESGAIKDGILLSKMSIDDCHPNLLLNVSGIVTAATLKSGDKSLLYNAYREQLLSYTS